MSKASTRKGYYIVYKQDGTAKRKWLGETRRSAAIALDNIGEDVLNEGNGYNYWVDYCLGKDVHGNVGWSNLDFTNSLLGWME